MKRWKFFPILVKEEVLKNMDLSDRLSFSKCSKKCRNLLSRIPNHLESLTIPYDNQLSVDDFLTLTTCRKSTIQKFKVKIQTADERDQVNQFLLKLNFVLKVEKIIMKISSRYSEMYKKCIGFCDPSFIELMRIQSLKSQELYEHILRTPQWKNSRQVSLNYGIWQGTLRINIDNFLHFKSIKLKVEKLSADDAWKLVQNSVNAGSLNDRIDISCRNPIQIDLIRQKIETELVGEWKGRYLNARYLVHPKNPDLVLEYAWYFNMFYVKYLTIEEFNMRLGVL
ncbi:unnamed protein product [Caenorhabditis brenneri]